MIEENPLVLNPHKISTGRTVCRPFRENSKTTVPRKRHVSSTRRFRGRAYVAPSFSREETRMSHAISHPGASAGARAAVRGARGPSERADSAAPALARGVPSVCWGVLESARVARFQPELQIAPRPLAAWFGDAPQRVAVVLVPSVHDASCRASVTAASDFRTITRAAGVASEPPGDCPGRRSRVKDPLLSTSGSG